MKTISRAHWFLLLLTAACGSGESAPAASQAILGDDSMLAVENGSANYTGVVAYGANGSFFYRTMTGAFTCNNATFGDPLVGTVKACFKAPRNPYPQIATKFVGNSPSGSYTWSDDVQGLAHDSGSWFITQPMSLHKVPLGSGLGTDKPAGEVVINLPKQQGGQFVGGNWEGYFDDLEEYNHFGDLDYHAFGGDGYAHALFVPTQGGGVPMIAVFDADTLGYVTSLPLPDLSSFGLDVSGSGSWVGARAGASPSDPITLWTSIDIDNSARLISFKFDEQHEIVTSDGKWVHPFVWNAGSQHWDTWNGYEFYKTTTRLTSPQVVVPTNSAGQTLLDFDVMQGGAFNEDGTRLYLLNGYCNSDARMHVFRVDPFGQLTLLKESYNSDQPLSAQPAADQNFAFESHPKDRLCRVPDPSLLNGFLAVFTAGASLVFESATKIGTKDCFCSPGSQEAEGLDYFDTRGLGIPGVPDSQLHAMLISNDAGDDQIWLKHFSFPDTTPSGPPDVNLALGQASYQSSDPIGASANRANDGNTDGNYWDGSVSHTDMGWWDQGQGWGQWWYVDLGGLRTIDGVNIYNRT